MPTYKQNADGSWGDAEPLKYDNSSLDLEVAKDGSWILYSHTGETIDRGKRRHRLRLFLAILRGRRGWRNDKWKPRA